MPRLRRRWPPHRVVAQAALGFAAVTALLAFAIPLPAALCALMLGGIAWMCGASSIYAALQADLPDAVRARGLSIYNLAYFFAMAGGAAGWGALAEHLGTRPALALAAAAMGSASLWLRRRPIGMLGKDQRASRFGLTRT